MANKTNILRQLLEQPELITMPCCYDALSAQLIQQAGFPLTFISGFAVSASQIGQPDTGLISYGEMVNQALHITGATTIPIIGDGDTGYGNAINVKRTVRGYAQAGLAGIMIEDQQSPKRCGHTFGKEVIPRKEAQARLQAAVDARDEGAEILIMARTDARTGAGFSEALARCLEFAEIGADIIFMEAPESKEEMKKFCQAVKKPTMANMIEHGKTPMLSQKELQQIGFKIAAYPLTLLNSAIQAIQNSLQQLKDDKYPTGHLSFQEIQKIIGFDRYDQESKRYQTVK